MLGQNHLRINFKSTSKRHQPFAMIFVTTVNFVVQRSWVFKS